MQLNGLHARHLPQGLYGGRHGGSATGLGALGLLGWIKKRTARSGRVSCAYPNMFLNIFYSHLSNLHLNNFRVPAVAPPSIRAVGEPHSGCAVPRLDTLPRQDHHALQP